jgi:N-hydroxyarylamine O-acetyltransferase
MEPNSIFELDVHKYLERINYTGLPDGSAKALFELQEAHYTAVPYENFDILGGQAISLELPDIYNKIVLKHRGGYCFELNGLFGELLRVLGYRVKEYFSRYLRDEPPLPMPRHRVLTVEAEGKLYFVDVGVGGVVPRWPLLMAPGLEQKQGDETYRLIIDPILGNVIQEFRHGQWSDYISFNDCPAFSVDFIATNYWCQHAEESIFNKEPMAAILTPEGRITMFGPEVRIFSPEGVKVMPVESDEDVSKLAEVYFKVKLTSVA